MASISDIAKYAIVSGAALCAVTVVTTGIVASNYVERKYHAQNVQADVQELETKKELFNSPGCQHYLQQRKELTEFLVGKKPDAIDSFDQSSYTRIIGTLYATLGNNPYCYER